MTFVNIHASWAAETEIQRYSENTEIQRYHEETEIQRYSKEIYLTCFFVNEANMTTLICMTLVY